MTVRKTESRLPANFQASDLGEAVVAADARCALVSFITSPIVVGRENVYVLFVTDAALASSVQSYDWSFIENGGAPNVQSTQHGECFHLPAAPGTLDLTVRLLGAGNAPLANLSLTQGIASPSDALETLIGGAKNQPGPRVANPDVLRELINDHNPYYQNVALQTPETGDGFKRFVFNMVFDGALKLTRSERKKDLEELAGALNNQSADLAVLAARGAGVSGIRLALLAMTLPGMLPFTELPEPADRRALADEQLRETLKSLAEEKRVDLFNLVRCPKSNITQCARILEALRNRYFAGTNFNDVLTGMSGTRAHWIIRHFREGPLIRS